MTRKNIIAVAILVLFLGLTPSPAHAGLWDTITGAASSVVNTVVDAGKSVVNTAVNAGKDIASTVIDAGKSVINTVSNAGQAVAGAVVDTAKGAWNWLTGQAGNAVNQAGQAINGGINAVGSAINAGANALDSGIQGMIDGAKGILQQGGNLIGGAIGQGIDFITGAAEALTSKLDALEKTFKDAFGDTLAAVGDVASTAADGINQTIGAAANGINKTLGKAGEAVETAISEGTEFGEKVLSAGAAIGKDMVSKVEKAAQEGANSQPFKDFMTGLKNGKTESYLKTGLFSSSGEEESAADGKIGVSVSSGTQVWEDSFGNDRWSKSYTKDWGSAGTTASGEEAAKESSWGKPTVDIDLYKNEHTYTVGPQLDAGISNTTKIGNATINSEANTQLLAGAEGTYGTKVRIENGELQAGVEASGFVGLRARGEASTGVQYGDYGASVAAKGEVAAGAGAEGSAMLTAGANGIGAEVKGDAFAGVRARGEIGTTVSYGDVKATGSVNGTVGAGIGGHFEASGKIGWSGVKAHVDMGAYLGIGGQVGFDVNLDLGHALDPVKHVVEGAVDTGKKVVGAIGNAAGKAIDAVAKSPFNPANWF